MRPSRTCHPLALCPPRPFFEIPMSKHDRRIVEEVKQLREENDRLRRKVKELEEHIEEEWQKERQHLIDIGKLDWDR